MQTKNRNLFIWLPLLAAWTFDLLFWGKVPGISFAVFVALIVIIGLVLAYRQEVKPAPMALALLVPIAFFTVMTFVRLEPLTTFLNYLAAIVLLGLFAHTFMGGAWPFYRMINYISGAVRLGISALSKQTAVFRDMPGNNDVRKRKLTASIARGLLLALPLVIVLAAILASADPIFEAGLREILYFLDLENILEYLWRAFMIVVLAYLLAGIYLHAVSKENDSHVLEEKDAKPFLGFVESTVVLGSVNLLFLAFVIVQFRYFFGGNANIHIDGYTFAEYARRGFGELVTTAFISLLLLQLLSTFGRREGKSQHRTFTVLGVTLVALVGVMLVSALQRLLLYENAYGFSRLRTYTHVFIYWLAGLLLVTLLLVVFHRRRFFTLAMLLAALGFITSLDLLNVDAFIVDRNISRALGNQDQQLDTDKMNRHGWEQFDFQYLASLSTDALPELSRQYHDNQQMEQRLAAAIACHAFRNEEYNYEEFYKWSKYNWSSFHLSRYRARQEWDSLMALANASDFLVTKEKVSGFDQYFIRIDGEKYDCYSSYMFD